jgi:hypothetical protein
MRFEGEEGAGAGRAPTLRIALEPGSGRSVVIEQGLSSARLRQLQQLPLCDTVASFARTRDGHRLRLVYPPPLELVPPVDEFVVAQAVGSVLDGLAWLHQHGVTHGAVGPTALVDGPTGGRLSLAGACSNRGDATPADDVFSAATLAFTLLFGEPPGDQATRDARLARCASPAVAEAIRQGLAPQPEWRPSAQSLASLVRGEQWLSTWDTPSKPPLLGRVRSSITSAALGIDRRWATVFGAAALLVVAVGGLVAAPQGDDVRVAAITPVVDLVAGDGATDPGARPTPAPASTSRASMTSAAVDATTAPTTTAGEVSVLSAAASQGAPATAAETTIAPAPSTSSPPPPPPPTSVPPPAPPTTTPPTTTHAASVATTRRPPVPTRATTTTREESENEGKGKGGKKGKGGDDEDDDEDDDEGGNDATSLLDTLIGLILGHDD